jgi:hypothetical protein
LFGLHLLLRFGGVDPVHELVSEYPLREYGIDVPYALALLSMTVAAVVLAFAMVRHGLVRERLARALLIVWCVNLLGFASSTAEHVLSPNRETTKRPLCSPVLSGRRWCLEKVPTFT